MLAIDIHVMSTKAGFAPSKEKAAKATIRLRKLTRARLSEVLIPNLEGYCNNDLHDFPNRHHVTRDRRRVHGVSRVERAAAAPPEDHHQLSDANRPKLAAVHREGGKLLPEVRPRCRHRVWNESHRHRNGDQPAGRDDALHARTGDAGGVEGRVVA